MRRFPFFCLLLGFLFGASQTRAAARSAPPALRADKARSTLTYTCVHTLHEWSGVNHGVDAVAVVDGAGQITKVAAAARVADFDSGNSNRDSHGLEVLEALKFPKVSFVSTRIVPAGTGLQVEGNLTFHGVTKPVAFTVSRQEAAHELTYTGGFTVLLSDYNIERPTFMMIPTDDEMKLALLLVFAR